MKDFILYPEALELKAIGFAEPCLAWYDSAYQDIINYDYANNSDGWLFGNHCSAPTYSQAFRWFREQYQLYAWVKVEYEYGGITPTYYITSKRQGDIAGGPFNTHEEAELACLKKLIEIVKENEKQI